MTFLEAISQIVANTTKALGAKVPNRITFFSFFTIVFGIITGLFIFGCFYIYLVSVLDYQGPVLDVYLSDNFNLLFYFSGFATPLTILFLGHYFFKKQNRLYESHSMSELMNSLDVRVILTFIGSLIVIFALTAYLSENSTDWFYVKYFELDPLTVFTGKIVDWRLKIFYDVLLMILHLLPALIVPVYLLYLKYGNMKVIGMRKHWNQILAYLVLWTMITLLFGFAWTVISRTIMSWVSIPFEEIYIPSILYLCFYVFLSILYYRVIGYIAFFSVIQGDIDESPGVKVDDDSELLDQ